MALGQTKLNLLQPEKRGTEVGNCAAFYHCGRASGKWPLFRRTGWFGSVLEWWTVNTDIEASNKMVHFGRENVVGGAVDHRVARQDGGMKGQWSW